MRTIKFRVWNLKDKEWENPAIVEIWDSSGVLRPLYDDDDGGEWQNKYVLQQGTEVLDRKGNEIFEGDLISYVGEVGRVSFMAGAFLVDWDNQTDTLVGDIMTIDMEIVGHIYDEKTKTESQNKVD